MSSSWQEQALLHQAVKEGYERLDAEMEALLREWASVRAAYEQVDGKAAPSELDTAPTGEWDALQVASEGLLQALDGMLNNTYTRLPQRLSLLRGKVSGFGLAMRHARARRRALSAPPPVSTETTVRRYMLGTGA